MININRFLNSIYFSNKVRVFLLAAMQFMLAIVPIVIIGEKFDNSVINFGLVAFVLTITFTLFQTNWISNYVLGLIPCTVGHSLLILFNCMAWTVQPKMMLPFFSILFSAVAIGINICLAHRITQQRRLALA